MFCGGCGAPLPEGMLICPKCGMMNSPTAEKGTADPAAQTQTTANNVNQQSTQYQNNQQPVQLDQNIQQSAQYDQNDQQSAPSAPQFAPGSMPEYNAYQSNPQMPGGIVPPVEQPGKGLAIGSLVLGIISIVLCMTGWIGVICGIVGLVLANMAKKQGNTSGMRTAGFVCSLIGLIIGAIILVVAIIAIITAAGMVGSMNIDLSELDNINIGNL